MIESFLLIGQSNMAGRGELSEVPPIVNEKILMFRNNQWVMAEEPVHIDKPELIGAGLCMSFGDYLSQKYDMEIGLIPCSMGGSCLDEWMPGEQLYENTVNATREAIKSSKLRGILWHQGEAECGTIIKSTTYKERWLKMFESLLVDIGFKMNQVPIVVGELGEFLKKRGTQYYADIVNEQLKTIVNEHENITFVSSEGLTDKGDLLHFDTKSLREFGIRYAKAWENLSGLE